MRARSRRSILRNARSSGRPGLRHLRAPRSRCTSSPERLKIDVSISGEYCSPNKPAYSFPTLILDVLKRAGSNSRLRVICGGEFCVLFIRLPNSVRLAACEAARLPGDMSRRERERSPPLV